MAVGTCYWTGSTRRGEHHQHQLETLSNSRSHFRSSEPTAGWQLEPAIGLDGFHAPQGEHHQHQLETLSNSLSRFRSSDSRVAVGTCYCTGSTRRRASIISISWKRFQTHSPISGPLNPQQGGSWNLLLDGFHAPQGEHHQHQLGTLSNSLSHFRSSEPTAGWQLEPGSTRRRASIISISWKPFQTHSPISGPLNPQQGGSWNLLLDGFHAPQGEHHPHSHFRSSEPTQGGSWNLLLDGFHASQGEHHQHQLETLSNSLSHFRSSEPTAGWQLEPAIGRVPRAAGRASSASAGNPFKLTLPFPVL